VHIILQTSNFSKLISLVVVFLYSRFAAHLSLDEKANQVAMTALRLGEWMFYLSGSGFISNLLT
jgi:hypothetical protein